LDVSEASLAADLRKPKMSLAIDIKSRIPDTRDARIERLLLRAEIEQFNAIYATALDDQRLSDWSEMFTDDGSYVVLSRENHDRGMPVGLIYCEGRAMIRDRAFALEKTAMFAPRYLRHIVSNMQVIGVDSDGSIRATANYLLLQVLFDRPDATLHQVGVYHDVFRNTPDGLKLAKRHCVYDNLLVPNALCLPV
jgi:anthranilate 1,2-dioxygenase small subunit